MEIMGGNDPISDIITLNPGKKIGKYNINYNKITDTEVILHAGHIDCISQLRSNADIVILEFFNTICHYKLLTDNNSSFKKVISIVNRTKVLELCELKELDVDYIIYDANDLKNDVDNVTIKLVDDRLVIEDYKTKYNIPDLFYDVIRLNIINFHKRIEHENLIFIRSYKTGIDSFIYKHYIDKYLSCKLIITHPVMSSNVNYPLSGSTSSIDLNDDAKSFLTYFYDIQKTEIISNPDKVKTDLEQYVISLGANIDYFIILDDPAIVGVDKIFISAYMKGMYNTKIPANMWI